MVKYLFVYFKLLFYLRANVVSAYRITAYFVLSGLNCSIFHLLVERLVKIT